MTLDVITLVEQTITQHITHHIVIDDPITLVVIIVGFLIMLLALRR